MEKKAKETSANKKVLDFNTKANSERVAKLKSNYKAKFTEQEKRMASTVRANEQLVAKNHELDNSNREFKKKEQQRRVKSFERRIKKEEIEKKMKETQQQKSREDAEQQQRRMEEREKKTIAAQQQKERENYSKVNVIRRRLQQRLQEEREKM